MKIFMSTNNRIWNTKSIHIKRIVCFTHNTIAANNHFVQLKYCICIRFSWPSNRKGWVVTLAHYTMHETHNAALHPYSVFVLFSMRIVLFDSPFFRTYTWIVLLWMFSIFDFVRTEKISHRKLNDVVRVCLSKCICVCVCVCMFCILYIQSVYTYNVVA